MAQQQDINWNTKPDLVYALMSIGPIVFLIFFGIKKILKELNPLSANLFFITFFSYLFFFTNLASYFGTHNLRLFTNVNYIFFSLAAFYGLQSLSKAFAKYQMIAFKIIFICLLVYFSFYNGYFIYKRIANIDGRIPLVNTAYLSNQFKEVFQEINKTRQKNQVILTGPYSDMGMIVPIYCQTRSYLGKPIFTQNFSARQQISDKIFRGLVNADVLKQFLQDNHITYILLTGFDDYFQPQNFEKISFIKTRLVNNYASLYQVVSY